MILTIKNANFSTAGIGTLSTYIIRKSIGSGVTHSIPNYIEKGLNATWTLTLVSGYTFGEYSIMMGSTPITPKVTETTMTITIPAVTANITISVSTINESTGEEDSGGSTPIVPPVVPPSGDTSIYNDGWELGALDSAPPSSVSPEKESTSRIRTITAINLTDINNLVVTWDDTDYKVAYYYYDVDDYDAGGKKALNTASYKETSPLTLNKNEFSGTKWVRLVLARKDNADMTVDEVQTSKLTLTSN